MSWHSQPNSFVSPRRTCQTGLASILSIMQKRDKLLLSVILSLITAFYGVFQPLRRTPCFPVKCASSGSPASQPPARAQASPRCFPYINSTITQLIPFELADHSPPKRKESSDSRNQTPLLYGSFVILWTAGAFFWIVEGPSRKSVFTSGGVARLPSVQAADTVTTDETSSKKIKK
jgi:hypothetical protein